MLRIRSIEIQCGKADDVYNIERWNKSSTLNRVALVSTTLAQVIPPCGCFHITNTATNRITTTTKSMSHHANRDQNYNNIYNHIYVHSQQNHNQEKERLCCSLLTLLRQLVGNLCPTGNGMTMNIIVKAYTCNLSCFTPARPTKIVKITFFGKQSRIENI